MGGPETVVPRADDLAVHSIAVRREAAKLIAAGMPRREVCRLLGVGYTSTYRWTPNDVPAHNVHCFRCEETSPNFRYTYLR